MDSRRPDKALVSVSFSASVLPHSAPGHIAPHRPACAVRARRSTTAVRRRNRQRFSATAGRNTQLQRSSQISARFGCSHSYRDLALLRDPSVYSPFCSSVYEDAPNNYLIDYTQAGPYIYTGIVALDPSGNVAFNYRYELLGFCATAWNAIQIHWENLNLE